MKEQYVTDASLHRKAVEWLRRAGRHTARREEMLQHMESPALLVLDLQSFFTDEASHAFVPAAKAIMSTVGRLMETFTKSGKPIVITRHSLTESEEPGMMGLFWRDTVREGSPASKLTDALPAVPDAIHLRKTRYSAFQRTDLEALLRKSGAKSVVVTGVTTHLCCDSTARDAFMRDFTVYFVIDATASWTEDLHVSSIVTLADGVVVPVLTDEIIRSMEGMR